MVGIIYKRIMKFITLIKESITFFIDEINKSLDEIDRRLIEINNKMKERNEYIEKLKDCTQLDCVECKFNKICEFSNIKKETQKEINYDTRRKRKKNRSWRY